jgi:hypothetical protein
LALDFDLQCFVAGFEAKGGSEVSACTVSGDHGWPLQRFEDGEAIFKRRRERVFGGEAILDGDHHAFSAGCELGANVVMAFEPAQDETATVEIEDVGPFCLPGRVAAAGDFPDFEILNGEAEGTGFAEMGGVFVVEGALFRNGKTDSFSRIESLACDHEGTDSLIFEVSIFGFDLIHSKFSLTFSVV